MKSFEEVLAADKKYQELKKKSAELAAKRGSMRAGSTRARVTTANANWARAAEARDAREEYLRREWEKEAAADHLARECLAELAEEERNLNPGEEYWRAQEADWNEAVSEAQRVNAKRCGACLQEVCGCPPFWHMEEK